MQIELVNPGRHYTSNATLLPQKGENPPRCFNCEQEIRFAKNHNGKNIPVSQMEDGRWTCHFNICPNPKPKNELRS